MSAGLRLLGVVLCGGKSSRMGQDKAALPCPGDQDSTFFSLATSRLQYLGEQVAVSGECSVQHQLPVIQDQIPDQGPMQGVLASLRFAKEQNYDACLFTPVDVVHLTNDNLASLVEVWNRESKLTVAFSDRIEPLIAIYPTWLIAELQECIDSDQRSLMRWIESSNPQTVLVPLASCRNINTPDDLRSLRDHR